jgi:alpha-tubulin suppressor-like RCC1 family protein
MKKLFTIGLTLLFTATIYSQCFTTISCGENHVTAKKTDGSLWVWGRGATGALGNVTEYDEYNPIQLGTGNNWQQIKAGYYNTFAIKNDGTLWATGANVTGELGIGSPIVYTNTLVQVGIAANWKTISPSDSFTIAMKTDNTLWGWGQNDGYQMGNGTCCSNQLSPIQISTATDWKSSYWVFWIC